MIEPIYFRGIMNFTLGSSYLNWRPSGILMPSKTKEKMLQNFFQYDTGNHQNPDASSIYNSQHAFIFVIESPQPNMYHEFGMVI